MRRSAHSPREPEHFRLFVALELPPQWLDPVADLLSGLHQLTDSAARTAAESGQMSRSKALGRVRFVRRDQLHITLAFLGSRPATDVPTIHKILQAVAVRHRAIDARLDREIGQFPPRGRARVLWLGIHEKAKQNQADASDHRAIQSLHSDLNQRLGEALDDVEESFSPRKTFHPHLTLARCRKPLPPPAARAITDGALEKLSALPDQDTELGRIALVRSHLSSAGARYETLATATLSNASL